MAKSNHLKKILENDLDSRLTVTDLGRQSGVSGSTLYSILKNDTQGSSKTQGDITFAINAFMKKSGIRKRFRTKDIFPDGTGK